MRIIYAIARQLILSFIKLLKIQIKQCIKCKFNLSNLFLLFLFNVPFIFHDKSSLCRIHRFQLWTHNTHYPLSSPLHKSLVYTNWKYMTFVCMVLFTQVHECCCDFIKNHNEINWIIPHVVIVFCFCSILPLAHKIYQLYGICSLFYLF